MLRWRRVDAPLAWAQCAHHGSCRSPTRSNLRCRRLDVELTTGAEVTYQIDLSGEVALVTGGTRNIGFAIAEALQAAGARVGIWGGADQQVLDRAVETLGNADRRVVGGLVDLRDEQKIASGFDDIETQLGPVSILVNNAAIRPYESLTAISLDAWRTVIDVNLTGAFLTSREMFTRLPASRNGAIVNIGGISAHRPGAGRAHVITSKAGLIGLTRALAAEGMGRIRANCVVPGAIETTRSEAQAAPRFLAEDAYAAGAPTDVARTVVPLADPGAQYLTGQSVHVSGGRFMA